MALGFLFDFVIALSLSILVECAVAFLFGYREINVFFAVAMVNLITNPLLNYSILVVQSLNLFQVNIYVLLILELVVVLAEWRMLLYSVGGSAKKLLILSFVMNLCSFLSGLVLFTLF